MNRLLTTLFLLTVATSTPSARVFRQTKENHYPRYAYKYSVNDPKTKDIKEHWEARDGDFVKGAYSLVEPDGKLRHVDYWADDAHGFIANVKRLTAVAPVTEILPVAVEETPEEPKEAPVEEEVTSPTPTTYGLVSGQDAPAGHDSTSLHGTGNLVWDPKTGSYGGWVPLRRKTDLTATIFNKKYIDGKLYKWIIGPISLDGRKLVFKVRH